MAYIWEAWIGQKIARMESEDGATIIVLESGRGVKFWSDPGLHFTLTNGTDGELWPEDGRTHA